MTSVIDFIQLATIIPLSRGDDDAEGVYTTQLDSGDLISSESTLIKVPQYLGIQANEIRIARLGQVNYLTLKPAEHDCTTLHSFEKRMQELEELHLCSLDKDLSFNWLVQIYHLLSIEHLESYHSGSLNGMVVDEIVKFDPSKVGGSVEFSTTSSSPFGFVRMFRGAQSLVTLTMHSALTVELNIKVSSSQSFTVLFNVLPLSDNRHRFMIDIYGLAGCKVLIGQVLKAASLYTINEDMEYYEMLGKRNLSNITAQTDINSPPSKMDLIHRFFEVYGSRIRGYN
jgi:hypothetical protein